MEQEKESAQDELMEIEEKDVDQHNDNVTRINSKPDRELIGCLMYLMVNTRADICFSISSLRRFQSEPTEELWKHLKRILRYLKGTKNLKLTFHSTIGPVLEAFLVMQIGEMM